MYQIRLLSLCLIFLIHAWHWAWRGYPLFQCSRIAHVFRSAVHDKQSDKESFLSFLSGRSDIYSITWNDIKQDKTIKKICQRYQSSHIRALLDLFPERNLLPWKFSSVPKHFWDEKENQRAFFDWYRGSFIVSYEEWASQDRVKDIYIKGGRGLIKQQYNGSLPAALRSLYPQEDWSIFRYPSGYWEIQENVANELNLRRERFKISKPSDWKNVTTTQLKKEGLTYPLNKYGAKRLLAFAFPELLDGQKHKPTDWDDIVIVKDFIGSVKKELNITCRNDWYSVTRQQLKELGGEGLLDKYGGLVNVLTLLYPEQTWEPHPNKNAFPLGYWQDVSNVILFMDNIKKKYSISTKEEWYEKISFQTLLHEGASSGITRYHGMIGLLRTAYPEESWTEFKKPKGYWKQRGNVKQIVKYIEKKLSISETDDWYRVSRRLIQNFGGTSPLGIFGLLGMLKIAYPDIKWDEKKLLRRNKKASQFFLRKLVESLFPSQSILEDYRHPEILFDDSLYRAELDIFLPDLKIAFEYNGEHHYHDQPIYGPVELYEQRDREKQKKCKQLDIQLVVVPYWWDESQESLKKMILENIGNVWEKE